jgi:23S rRNA (uracil1939-C5)-methyltransferase
VASIYSVENGRAQLHYGDKDLPEKIFNLQYQVSPLAFFQVNHEQTEKMMDIIKEYAQIRTNDTILDAYCGTGSIALNLAGSARQVVGVESFKSAIRDAKRNAFKNNITNCKFIKGACEHIIPALEEKFDVVILDPPRSGCKPELIQALVRKAPKRIVYVSCNPATLARDLALLVKEGYNVAEVQPIDMFAQTTHVETVVRIYRG